MLICGRKRELFVKSPVCFHSLHVVQRDGGHDCVRVDFSKLTPLFTSQYAMSVANISGVREAEHFSLLTCHYCRHVINAFKDCWVLLVLLGESFLPTLSFLASLPLSGLTHRKSRDNSLCDLNHPLDRIKRVEHPYDES